MNIDDYKKLREKIYEDFKKKNPEEYAKLKEIEKKDLEKFFTDNFAKKKKAKKLKKITPEQVENAEKRLRQLLGGKDHRSTSTYAFAKKPRQYN